MKKFEDEIKFKDLLKNPSRLFGWTFVYVSLILIIIGVFYVKHIDEINFNSVTPNINETDNSEVVIPNKKGGVTAPADLKLISDPSLELLEKGKQLFQNNCASCHGENGLGDGIAGKTLVPAPRNFHENQNWVNGNKFSGVFGTIANGIIENGMASYEYLPVEDRIALTHFVRSFNNESPKINSDEISELDLTFNLSEGQVLPNTIPLEKAQKLLISENDLRTKFVDFTNLTRAPEYETVKRFISDHYKYLVFISAPNTLNNFNNFKKEIILNIANSGFYVSVFQATNNEMKKLFEFSKKINDKSLTKS